MGRGGANKKNEAGEKAENHAPLGTTMGQDMFKGRRTEIDFLNGFVVREGERAGIRARANEALVDLVKKVERGELKQDPRNITDLRFN